jgi:hypothetical protein
LDGATGPTGPDGPVIVPNLTWVRGSFTTATYPVSTIGSPTLGSSDLQISPANGSTGTIVSNVFTPPQDGLYQIDFCILFDGGFTGGTNEYIDVNIAYTAMPASSFLTSFRNSIAPTEVLIHIPLQGSAVLYLTTSQPIEFRVVNNTAAPRVVTQTSPSYYRFSIVQLGFGSYAP